MSKDNEIYYSENETVSTANIHSTERNIHKDTRTRNDLIEVLLNKDVICHIQSIDAKSHLLCEIYLA